MSLIERAQAAAQSLASKLAQQQVRLVLAESCTSGMASAMLGQCPGISQWFCGSQVVYRSASKQQWLDISAEKVLRVYSAESFETSQALADQILGRTNEANLAVAITGHLGPQAPVDKDGLVYLAARSDQAGEGQTKLVSLEQVERIPRQIEAAAVMLEFAAEQLLVD